MKYDEKMYLDSGFYGGWIAENPEKINAKAYKRQGGGVA